MLGWLITVLQVAGLLLFCRGFFPAKLVQTGYNDAEVPVPPKFDRLVVMVVDAMRSDLMLGEHSRMSHLHGLVRSGNALPFTAYSNPPTVTLPRLKGLTTGSTPNFLDAVLNIAESDTSSTLKSQDSWVWQLHRQNKAIHFYGDDTWIKLFPDVFDVSDGTSSFYVSDYTEVDNNVTRHVLPELQQNQWDVLILHYLGMDHIGHKSGPFSPLMPGKQQEMDDIIKTVYDHLDDKTLFVVLGDHGMNDVGNHGGATSGETSAAMALISKQFSEPGQDAPLPIDPGYSYYTRIQQIDLVPSLSFLLGFPLPRNSLGLVIPEILATFTDAQQQKIVDYMCEHLLNIGGDPELLGTCTLESLKQVQQSLTRASSAYVLNYMIAGVGLLVLAVLLSTYRLLSMSIPRESKWLWTLSGGLYAVAMFGSSTVEEEHQFWFWGLSGLLAYRLVRSKRAKKEWLIALVAFRLVRSWTHPGQKWTTGLDISRLLVAYPPVLWTLVLGEYVSLAKRLRGGLLGVLALIFSFTYKVSVGVYGGEQVPQVLHFLVVPEERLLLLARIVFGIWTVLTLIKAYNRSLSVELLEVLLVMQCRPANIPLVFVFYVLRAALRRTSLVHNDSAVALIGLFLSYSSFFAAGGSNSLATVDLANAYNGVGSYNIAAVTLLTYVSNWIGPLYWWASTNDMSRRAYVRQPLLQFFYSLAVASVCGACLVLKDHLFIWTVFSPKLLYVGAWLVIYHIVTETVIPAIYKSRIRRK